MIAPSLKETGMPASRLHNERGIALAVAIFALVVIGALVAGTFFAGRLEQQSGQNGVYAGQAAEGAEAALSDALATMNATTLTAMLVGDTQGLTSTTSLGGVYGSTSSSVRRLTTSLFMVEALGQRNDAAGTQVAKRKLGTIIRLASANISVNAGLTALGDVLVSGNSTVSGTDATPSEWTAAGVTCPPTADVAGVRYNGTLDQKGSSTITGSPKTQLDPTLDSTNIFGGTNFAALKAMRTLTLTSNVSGLAAAVTGSPAVCNTAVETNWGAPTDKTSPCFNYFPIIYHYGDLSISGTGAGQGILLVEGNLTVQGQIDFYGPVIVTGGVDVRGTGSDDVKFYGGILAQNVTLDDSRLTGNATVNYSSCAIRRALQGSAVPTRLDQRSWAQLYETN
jgi:Tfp pilus assembly protein PilX